MADLPPPAVVGVGDVDRTIRTVALAEQSVATLRHHQERRHTIVAAATHQLAEARSTPRADQPRVAAPLHCAVGADRIEPEAAREHAHRHEPRPTRYPRHRASDQRGSRASPWRLLLQFQAKSVHPKSHTATVKCPRPAYTPDPRHRQCARGQRRSYCTHNAEGRLGHAAPSRSPSSRRYSAGPRLGTTATVPSGECITVTLTP